MPEYIRAMVAILVIAFAVFYAARPVAIQVVPSETFSRWRTAWFGLTLAFFLSHNFWVYALLLIVWMRYLANREQHVVGLFLAVLFVAPPASMFIPGLGLVNQLFPINHYNLLVLALLLPLAWRLFQRRDSVRLGKPSVDKMVLGYLAVICMLAFRDTSITGGLRQIFTYFVDIFLPYYVVSRSLRDLEDFRSAFLGFVMGAAVVSALALFEVLRYWKLYQGVLAVLGFNSWQLGGYLERMGVLRPDVSLSNSIIVGYVMMVAVGCYLFLMKFISNNGLRRRLGLGLLVGGVIWSLSRGPWVGLCLLFLMFILTGERVISRLFKAIAGGAIALTIASLVPAGQFLLDLLPFVGENEAGSVEYRGDLLTQALPVIGRNFWFGSTDHLSAPEFQSMYSGGIIDLVNTYMSIALNHGMVGLGFFASAFIIASLNILKAMGEAKKRSSPTVLLGRSLLASMLSIMLVIYTASSIGAVPIVYWLFLGMSVAYHQMVMSRPVVDEIAGRQV